MLLVGAFVDSCKKAVSADSIHVLYSEENRRFGLSVLFYGREFHQDNGSQLKMIEYLSVKDRRSGVEVRYVPLDPSSLSSSDGFFRQVWSPDESLLILPLGRFEGFTLISSPDVMTKIASSRFDDNVRVQLRSGVRLWHEFRGWASPTEFDFQAGLSGQLVLFRYTVSSHRITAREAISGDFVGVTSGGEVQVGSLPTATK
jgi:hypothetical protein